MLNRITSKCNTFDMIVAANIPGLETVHHFPVLSAVAGILIQLLLRGSEQRLVEMTVYLSLIANMLSKMHKDY